MRVCRGSVKNMFAYLQQQPHVRMQLNRNKRKNRPHGAQSAALQLCVLRNERRVASDGKNEIFSYYILYFHFPSPRRARYHLLSADTHISGGKALSGVFATRTFSQNCVRRQIDLRLAARKLPFVSLRRLARIVVRLMLCKHHVCLTFK